MKPEPPIHIDPIGKNGSSFKKCKSIKKKYIKNKKSIKNEEYFKNMKMN